jgi:hypothetical protein
MRSHWWSNSGAPMSFIYMKIFKNREVIDNTNSMSIYCLTKLQNITQCLAQENKRTNLVLIELMGVSHDPTWTTDDLWLDLFFSIEFCFLDLDLNFSNMVEIYICLCIYFMKKFMEIFFVSARTGDQQNLDIRSLVWCLPCPKLE